MSLNHRKEAIRTPEQTRRAAQYQISPRHLFVFLAGYFFLQLLSRVLISDSANLDEAEQLILTQRIRWGYAAQPPLYTWLQALFFTVFGINIFALALLKNSLLFTTYAFNYLSAKQITGG
jgi:4-amino-4-deoxy-L-arabinose transferase-like glycosyltransferase